MYSLLQSEMDRRSAVVDPDVTSLHVSSSSECWAPLFNWLFSDIYSALELENDRFWNQH